MKRNRFILFTLVFLFLIMSTAFCYAKKEEWKKLSEESDRVYMENRIPQSLELAKKALKLVEKKYGKEHIYYAKILNDIAIICDQLKKFDEAETAQKEAIVILKKIGKEKDPEYFKAVGTMGMIYSNQKDHGKAAKYLQESVNLLENSQMKNSPEAALTKFNLAYVYFLLMEYRKAEPLFIDALKTWEKTPERYPLDIADASYRLGEVYFYLYEYKKAVFQYLQAIEIWKKSPDKNISYLTRAYINAGISYSNLGEYSNGEKVLLDAININEKSPNKDIINHADALMNLGKIYVNLNKFKKAENCYTRSLKICEEKIGKESRYTISVLNAMGELYSNTGRYKKAETFFRNSVELSRKLEKKYPGYLLKSLRNLAGLHIVNGKYSKAEEILKTIIKEAESIYGKNHLRLVPYLNELALVYFETGNYNKAKKLFEQSLEIDIRYYGKNHHETAEGYKNLGNFNYKLGNYENAESFFRQALAIEEKIYGKNHSQYASTLNSLAALLFSQGRYSEAEEFYKKALEISEKVLGKNHPLTASVLSNMGSLYIEKGEYSRGESYYKRALEINEKILGDNHPDTLKTLSLLASLYAIKGDYKNAENYYEFVIIKLVRKFGKNHLAVTEVMTNLGNLYEKQGKLDEAEQIFKRVVDIETKILGKDNPQLNISLNNLAVIYSYQNKTKEAEDIFRRVYDIQKKSYSENHPLTVTSLNNIAFTLKKQGKLKEADDLFKKVLQADRKNFGNNHPYVALDLYNLGLLMVETGNKKEGFNYLNKASKIDNKIIKEIFNITSEYQKAHFMNTQWKKYITFLSLIVKCLNDDSEAVTAGLDLVLKRKGMILDAHSKDLETLRNSDKPEVKRIFKKLREVSSLIASLSLAGPKKMKIEDYKIKLNELEYKRVNLEEQLAKLSAKFAVKLKSESVNSRKISKLLPVGSVLVEFILINPRNFSPAKGEKHYGEPEYFAFILPSSKKLPGNDFIKPTLVQLGKASVIDKAVKAYRQEIKTTSKMWENGLLDEASAEKELAEKGKEIYKLVVAPIRKSTGENKIFYFSPDGTLNLIPFGAIPDESGKYLVETCEINYLSSGKDLLGYEKKEKSAGKNLIIADPYFGMPGPERISAAKALTSPNKVVALRGNEMAEDFSKTVWKRLPGTRKEAGEIKELLKDEETEVFVDQTALEEVVKSLISPGRLHFATHGFFLDDMNTALPHIEELEQPSASGRIAQKADVINNKNPLVRSGIVLAGGNLIGSEKVPAGSEDGILTALEISGLPFFGTDLVVLSACETGLGVTGNGEGVYGLRRAFQLAGARTVVMSLWSVPDEDTRKLMVKYYKGIKEGEGKSRSLQNAMLSIIKERREKNGAAHPFFWGAFISVGEP